MPKKPDGRSQEEMVKLAIEAFDAQIRELQEKLAQFSLATDLGARAKATTRKNKTLSRKMNGTKKPVKFIPDKTGRVVKQHPTPPRLGRDLIRAAVEAVVVSKPAEKRKLSAATKKRLSEIAKQKNVQKSAVEKLSHKV